MMHRKLEEILFLVAAQIARNQKTIGKSLFELINKDWPSKGRVCNAGQAIHEGCVD